MHYKTILLELIRQDRELHDRLKQSGTLAATLDRSAQELKDLHESLKQELTLRNPGSEPAQWSGAALELALKEMESRFGSKVPEDEADSLTLDAAMNFLRRATPSV